MAKRYVTNDDTSARMFRSDFLERFTRVHPAVPHLIFVPVIAVMVVTAFRAGLSLGSIVLLVAIGAAAWTITEYLMHRYVFHVDDATQAETLRIVGELGPGEPALPALRGLLQKYYFIMHGVHHHYPNDTRRLVMPPAASVPLAVAFYLVFLGVAGAHYTPPLFAGFVLGYLVYDTTHYAVHHFPLRGRISLYLRKQHLRHHYGDSTKDFGVSSPLWDFILRTYGRAAGTKTSAAKS